MFTWVIGEPGRAYCLGVALCLTGAGGVHLGLDGHVGAIDALAALELLLREEKRLYACLHSFKLLHDLNTKKQESLWCV